MMTFISKEPIDKGWSGDRKFKVTDENGVSYLLRTSPIEKLKKKRAEFDLLLKVKELGIAMCEPIDFWVGEDGASSLWTWIDGVDAREGAKGLDEDTLYAYGLEAGGYLKKIHSIPAPEGREGWAVYFNRKADKKIKMYEECTLKYENGQAFIDYINENRHLLEGRPLVFQHGDYHSGNMMLDKAGKLYVIDFDRSDFGDPWEEFNRIVWCVQSSHALASGMIDGYFPNGVPMEFWRLLALYISSNTLSSLPWAVPFGEGEIATMRNQAREVLEWYDGMKNPIPTWYTSRLK